MSHDLPIPRQDSGGDTTVEWDTERPTGSGPANRLLHRLGGDRRPAQVAGVLGAVAAFASLVDEWSITTVPNAGSDGDRSIRVPSGVAELGGLGTGYLIGLFGVLGSLALVLYGSPGARRNARAVGLACAGLLGALLVAAAATVDDLAGRMFFLIETEGFRVEHGRGLTLAFVATALLGAAVWLAGRVTVAGPVADPAGPRAGDAPGGRTGAPPAASVPDPDPTRGDGWTGPPRHQRTDGGDDPHGPIDLTVSAAPPIVPRGYGDEWPTADDASGRGRP